MTWTRLRGPRGPSESVPQSPPQRARARARVAALRIHAMAHGTVVVEARGED